MCLFCSCASSLLIIFPSLSIGTIDADSLESFMAGLAESMGVSILLWRCCACVSCINICFFFQMEKKRKKEDLLASIDTEMRRVEKLIELVQPAMDRLKTTTTTTTTPTRHSSAGIAADVERYTHPHLTSSRRHTLVVTDSRFHQKAQTRIHPKGQRGRSKQKQGHHNRGNTRITTTATK